jgi:serine/threonine protein kinase
MAQVGRFGADPPIQQSSNTVFGSVFGTPAYMSPEQARGEIESVEKPTDVFALGGVLCKMMTGSPVYLESNMAELRELARNGSTAPAIARIRKSRASKALKRLAISCISSDAKNRPADARDLIRCLDRIEIVEQWRKRISFALLALAIGFACFLLFELTAYLSLKVLILDADGKIIDS